jgi:tetratricopeptide (TPR) repeat protein
MHIVIPTTVRKIFSLAVALAAVSTYTFLISREFAASHFARAPELASLQRAVRLRPGNADYHNRLGRYFELVSHDRVAATAEYQKSAEINPHKARYWFDLAKMDQLRGDMDGQRVAIERGIRADPTTPDVAWEAANFYLVHGDIGSAFREFRLAVQGDPSLAASALELCWRAKPDANSLLHDAVPPQAETYVTFLNMLVGKNQIGDAAQVWTSLVKLGQPFEATSVFDYIKYLLAEHAVEQAQSAWQQAAPFTGLSGYLPSPTNLVVNGDFSLDVLNAGFDWNYQQQPSVTLTLDPTDFHAGRRSLLISFDGPGVADAGIYQAIPVQPNSAYEFTAYYKTDNVEGAGGPRYVLLDYYSNKKYFESEELKNAEFWKSTSGTFLTSADTRLLTLRVDREPVGSPIRGKLWIDDFRLVPKQP